MVKELVCINCPMGCRLTVSDEGGTVAVTGNTCKRGETYGKDELTNPKRTVTALVGLKGRHEPLPVKTSAPIPKGKVLECAKLLKTVEVEPPIKIGDVVAADICGTGVSVVATAEAK